MLANDYDLAKALRSRGITRRQLVKFCSAALATLALPERYLAQTVAALGKAKKPVLVWLQFQDCTGCSESMLRSSHPEVADIVLDLLSWEYHEVIMAGAGSAAVGVLDRIVKEEKGKYLVVVEGAIPMADGGAYCTIGGRSAIDIATQVCGNAAATIAVGACAFDGGLVRSSPNPTGALGVSEAVPSIKVINMAGCPHNPANTAAVLVHYLTFNDLPALDQYDRPLFAYGRVIHDMCERRAHFDAGRFVTEWGDDGHKKGWCLYKMGCKGPEATFNCPVVQWNDHTSWPIRAGHGCIACASPRFWDHMSPFYDRLPNVPGFGVEVSAGEIGLGMVGAVVAGVTVHGLISTIRPAPKLPDQPPPLERITDMARIVVDPVTRIEGHLRIEANLEGGKLTDAWSSGTMFRGIEMILQGRDPREAWIWAQRICGVCTMVHAIASVRAVEDALQIDVPENARLVRHLIAGAQMVQDHVIHFYHLHALDWVDVAAALKADPAKTSQIAQSISNSEKSSATYFRGVQQRVRAVVDSGQLSLFASGYWGHPAFALPPEVDLLAVAHYLEALAFQKDFIRIHAILGGKNPHPQSFLVGGMSTAMDPNEPAAVINPDTITFMRSLVRTARKFVNEYLVPDVLAVAPFYKNWFSLGGGVGNFLCYGDYSSGDPNDPKMFLFPRGIVMGGDITKVLPIDPSKITETVAHSWYEYSSGDASPIHPSKGETNPKYSGPKPPYDHLDVDAKYSWLKAPRYDGKPMEVGPLARMVVGYASGKKEIVDSVNGALKELKAPPAVLFSTLGRLAARALEAQIMVNQLETWVDKLDDNLSHGNTTIFNPVRWDPGSWPKSASGHGWHEAPRGSLGHWVEIEGKAIKNYQAVVPTTWNAGPRDAQGQRGPYEAALLNTPVADPNRPLEILRTIHSFDPCIACAVHVIDAQGREYTIPRVA